MGQYKVYEIKQSIFKANDDAADVLRAEMKKDHCFLLNLMSSPGSGKTTTLTRTIEKLGDKMNIGIMEADIDSDVDAERISHTGVKKVIQLHTGGMCHLDADMTRQGLTEMGTDDLDLVVLENVGNLVCPAEFEMCIRDSYKICRCGADFFFYHFAFYLPGNFRLGRSLFLCSCHYDPIRFFRNILINYIAFSGMCQIKQS